MLGRKVFYDVATSTIGWPLRRRQRFAGTHCDRVSPPPVRSTSRLCQWQKLKAAGVNATTDLKLRVFNNRTRRAAQRQGLILIESRRPDPRALDYGGHWLIDVSTGGLVAVDVYATDHQHDATHHLVGHKS